MHSSCRSSRTRACAASPDLLGQGIPGKHTLLRRATYDLTGLPPSPQEMKAFVADTTPVRLRQGRRSAARLARLRRALGPLLARYRALCRYHRRVGAPAARTTATPTPGPTAIGSSRPSTTTCPYDQFIMQQLAADKIKDNDPANLAALGFLTVGERFGNANDMINDRIDVVTKGFLGLTVACARCHDHMFDPDPDEGLLRPARRLRLDGRCRPGPSAGAQRLARSQEESLLRSGGRRSGKEKPRRVLQAHGLVRRAWCGRRSAIISSRASPSATPMRRRSRRA